MTSLVDSIKPFKSWTYEFEGELLKWPVPVDVYRAGRTMHTSSVPREQQTFTQSQGQSNELSPNIDQSTVPLRLAVWAQVAAIRPTPQVGGTFVSQETRFWCAPRRLLIPTVAAVLVTYIGVLEDSTLVAPLTWSEVVDRYSKTFFDWRYPSSTRM